MILKAKPSLLIVGGTGFIGYHLALKAKKKGMERIKPVFKQTKKK